GDRDKIQAHKSKEQGAYDKDQHIKVKEAKDVVHNILGDRPMVVAHRNNGTWVQAPLELQDPVLNDQQVAHDLDAPGGGTGRATQEHQPEEYNGQKGGPSGIVRRNKTGGGDHAQYLKTCMPDDIFRN